MEIEGKIGIKVDAGSVERVKWKGYKPFKSLHCNGPNLHPPKIALT